MCANGTPESPYLAQWSWEVDGGPPDVAAVRNAAWATAQNWGLGALADDIALIVAEFSSNAWTHGGPPIAVTLRLQESVLIIEVSDAGSGLALFTGPHPLGAGGRGFPAAVAIAQEIGIEGRAQRTTVWAQLPFQWVPAETESGLAAP